MNAKMGTSIALLLLLLGCSRPTVQAVDLDQFLNDPTFVPFVQKALKTGICLTDPAIGKEFDLDLCPSLLGMLEAVNGGATEYDITCEPACAQSVYSLQPDCVQALAEEFAADGQPVGVLGSRFFQQCADLQAASGNGGGGR